MQDKHRIIDAHLHFVKGTYFDEIAKAAEHENNAEHLQKEYARLGIVGGVVMSNGPLEKEHHQYPTPLRYCIGLDRGTTIANLERQAALVEENLKQENCVGIKFYPGYNHFYVYDEILTPFYELAEQYDKPIAIHTGLTASTDGLLTFSHPLTLDRAAVQWPKVRIVMCHFGNPWLADAAAVIEKNPNVAVDLSGLLERKIPSMSTFVARKHGYMQMLTDWLEYLDVYDRVMFGTDWPLANLEDYIDFTERIVPAREQDKVFFQSANTIYGLGL